MNTEGQGYGLSTADLVAAKQKPRSAQTANRRSANAVVVDGSADARLAPLFSPEGAADFRARWTQVQSSFVDDPKLAVRHGDELVAEVMTSLAESFSKERTRLEAQLEQPDDTATENLRVALQRYRSFFERLLAL